MGLYLCCKFRQSSTKCFRCVSLMIFVAYVLELMVTLFNTGYEVVLWKKNEANLSAEDKKSLLVLFVIAQIFNGLLNFFFLWLCYLSYNLYRGLGLLKEDYQPKCSRPIDMRRSYVTPQDEPSDLVSRGSVGFDEENSRGNNRKTGQGRQDSERGYLNMEQGGGQRIFARGKQNLNPDSQPGTESTPARVPSNNPYQAPEAGFLSFDLEDESQDAPVEEQQFYVAKGLSGKPQTIPKSQKEGADTDSQELKDVMRFKEEKLGI